MCYKEIRIGNKNNNLYCIVIIFFSYAAMPPSFIIQKYGKRQP